jgi:hypothetical protein
MDEEKGKNRGFRLKTHNEAAKFWGKGGKQNGHSFIVAMFLLGMRPQHLFLYEKNMVIRLGDKL